MKTKHLVSFMFLAAAMAAMVARADWVRSSKDLQVGAGPVQTLPLAAGAGTVYVDAYTVGGAAVSTAIYTVASGAATKTNFLADADYQLLSADPGLIVGSGSTNSVTLNVVTSGVSVALHTWTTGAETEWSPSPAIRIPAGALLTVTTAGPLTSGTILAVTMQRVLVPAAAGTERTLVSVSAGDLLPVGASVTLTAITSGVSVALGTLTNGALSYAASLPHMYFGASDVIKAQPDGVTNGATLAVSWQPYLARTWMPARACLLTGVSAGEMLPAGASVALSAITSGVSVALGTLTNGATWTAGTLVRLAAGDALRAVPSGLTNDAPLSVLAMPLYTSFIAPLAGQPARVVSLRVFDVPGLSPGGSTSVLSAVLMRHGRSALESLASFTNGAAIYQPESPVYLYDGDKIDLLSSGVTNAATVRVVIETQE